jgi:hypothetical protein
MRSKRKNKVSKQRLRQSKVRKTSLRKTSLRKSKRTQRRKSKKSSRKTRRSFIKKSRKKKSKLKGGSQESVDEVLEKLVGTWRVELIGSGGLIKGKKDGDKINSVKAGMSVLMQQRYEADEVYIPENFTIVKQSPTWMNTPIYRGEGTSEQSYFTLEDIQVENVVKREIVMIQYSDGMSTKWKFTISENGNKLVDGSLSVIKFDDTEQQFGIFTAQKIESSTPHAQETLYPMGDSDPTPSEIPRIMLTVRNTTMGGSVAFYDDKLPINTTIGELREGIIRQSSNLQDREFNLYKTKEMWIPQLSYGWKLKRTTPLVDDDKTLQDYGILANSSIEIEIVQP